MIPTLFKIWFLPLHSFGLLMVMAFLAAWRMLYLNLSRAGKPPELAERMITWAAVGGVIGARLGYLISFPTGILDHPIETIFSGAGFVFHWGLIGGALALWMLMRKVGENYFIMADLSAAALAIGYGVGRIGCQLSGDGDYGMPSDLPWAMGYPLGAVPTAGTLTVHPTPVYETIVALLIACILCSGWAKRRFSGTGQVFGLYLLLSSLSRFCVEFLRIEPVVLSPFTQAQLISLLLGVVGVILIMSGAHRKVVSS